MFLRASNVEAQLATYLKFSTLKMSERTEEYKRQCVEQVMGIGFSEEQALTALQVSDYDVNKATELIVQGGKCLIPICRMDSKLTV